MPNVSDCGDLYDKLWKLSDIDKLSAQVPLPDDVIDVPDLGIVLLVTHSAVESAKVCYTDPRLEDSQRVILDVL